MKKVFAVFGIVILTLLCGVCAFAADLDDSGMWEYQTSDSGVELTSYKGTQTDVYVPSRITVGEETLSVTKVGDELFKGNTSLNSATLGEGITEIGASAFEGATNLVCIVTPESLTTIGANAFSGCTAFNSVILYDSVTSIGENAFLNCDNLTIYCNENTTAYNYAVANSIKYEILNPDAEPEIYTVDGVTYYIMNGEAIAISFDNSVTEVVVPAMIQNHPVTNIKNAFEKSSITSIILPNTIKELEESAFSSCKSLSQIYMPDSITSIGTGAFSSCISLTSFVIPNGIKVIPMDMFCGCTSLKSVTIPDSVISINQYAFMGCRNLTTIIIPENVTKISHSAFLWCTRLNKVYWNAINVEDFDWDDGVFEDAGSSGNGFDVVFGNKVERIPAYTFNGSLTPNIKSVTFSKSITSVGKAAFSSSLQDVYVDDLTAWCNITFDEVSDNPMYYAKNIYLNDEIACEIVLPEELTKINDYTFYNWKTLTDVTLPKNLISIGERAFSGCSALDEITIPDTVTSIGNGAYAGCTGIRSATLPDSITEIPSTLFLGCSKLENITIPDGVKRIGASAFRNCSFASIDLPDCIISIGVGAFFGCAKLTELVIPDAVSAIEEGTFYNCSSLKGITIPNTVSSIGSESFYGCSSLEVVVVPESVTALSIDSFPAKTILGVFENSYAHIFALENSLLYYITIGEDTPTITVLDGITYLITNAEAIAISFDGSTEDVVVPAYVDSYPVTSIRTIFKGSTISSITIPETVTKIEDNAFSDCTSLTNIVMSNAIAQIGSYAFSNCKALAKMTIPDAVSAIEEGTFYNCSSLKEITIPNSITSIGSVAFGGCLDLKNITIPDKVSYIGNNAFNNCWSLLSITIPENVTYVGSGAFSYCSVLEEINWNAVSISNTTSAPFADAGENGNGIKVVFGDGVKAIPANIFGASYSSETCPNTTSVYIPDSVTNIGSDAFKFNISLKDLHIDSLAAWCNISFDNTDSNPISRVKNMYINNEKVTAPVIPDTVKTINKYAFYGAPFTEITIPDSVIKIEAQAFYKSSVKNLTIPKSVTSIGPSAFANSAVETVSIMGSPTINKLYNSGGIFAYCSSLKTVNIFGNISIVDYTFRDCPNITNVNIFGNIRSVGLYAFADSDKVKTLRMPASVTSMSTSAFPISTILVVDENSYAHTFAVENDLLYFILHKTENPEISYGSGLSGTATYTDGTAASGATVEILYDDGTVKETVTTDADGNYEFTYAEVGRYTIRVTDTSGNTASEVVSVKRMNVFDVYVAGETNLVLKKGYTVSGTVSPASATVILTDTDGNIIASVATTDGEYSFADVPNGTHIIKAETENGTVVKEITVFNGDITVDALTVETAASYATITGYVEVEDRDFNHHKRNWVEVTIYNEEGIAVDSQKTDGDGEYTFTNLPLGEYSIVAETNEMRPDKHKKFDRSHKLTGYAYVEVTEAKTYENVNIVLYEESDHKATISGKVTAQGESQDCEVILTNVFKHEIAKCETGKNGKYTFKNIPDGLYYITAITNSNGMGYAVVVVRDGRVYGDTDITIRKSDRVHRYEERMRDEIPDCDTREKALLHKDKIAEHKRFYDSLPEKEKKQFSKDYIRRLNKLAEFIADARYDKPDGVEIENGGTVISGDELDSEEKVEFVLNVTETSEHEIPDDGIKTREDYEQQSIHDHAKDKHIAKYYDITLTKNGKEISNVRKYTDTTGKLRITMEIPEEYRGHKHYTFIHMHKGEAVTLVDQDDNPNTVTFEVDKFSTFALAYSDTELTEVEETAYPASIVYDESTGKISVSSTEDGTLYIATYAGSRLESVEGYTVTANASAVEYDFASNQAAFVWNADLTPLCEKFVLGN